MKRIERRSFLSAAVGSLSTVSPIVRKLSDFTNPDGKPPDGRDSKTDDTSSFRKALAAGPGPLYVGPGFYRCGDIEIPPKVTLVGAGASTVIRSSGPKQIFSQRHVRDWGIRDVVLDGEAEGDWKSRIDDGQSGILVENCEAFEIAGVDFRNFNGTGLELTRTPAWHNDGNIQRLTASGNYVGIRFDFRAEYLNVSHLNCYNNVRGCVIHGGNNKVTASNFLDNVDGIVIEDLQNGSHGVISDCLINHNERYALLAKNVRLGMVIEGCCFFVGSIHLEDCVGVNITSGIIACSVKTVGSGANRIAGNYIIPRKFQFDFTPASIVRENFTEAGMWSKNM